MGAGVLEQDELVRMAFEVAGLGTCVWDLGTGKIAWDERRRGMVGAGECGPGDLAGFLATVHPEDRERVRSELEEVMGRGGGEYSLEYRVVRADGGVGWIASRGKVLAGTGTGTGTGGAGVLVAVAWDVTGRREAEAALRESERRFRELADTVPEIVWSSVVDERGEVVRREFNRRFYEYTGYEAWNVPGLPWDLIIHPADREAARVAWAARAADPRPYEMENRWRRTDGAYRWFLSRAVPVADGRGKVVGWVSCATDIHDRKVVEEELRASRESLELALDIAGMGTWTWDVVGGTGEWDARTREIMGVGAAEAVGPEVFRGLVHPDDWEAVRAADAAGLAAGRDYLVEYRVVRRSDGQVRWISSRGRVWRDGGGRAVRVTGVCSDVTGRRRAGEAVRRERETLELAIDVADLGTWSWDVATGESEWSARCRRIFGVGVEERISPGTFARLVHPEDRARAVGRRAEQKSEAGAGKDYAEEFRIIRPDGSVRWVASRGRTTVDAKTGRAVRVTGVVGDVTDRKRAEEALRESEQHYRELAEAMPHVVWTADAGGNVDYVNARAGELMGVGAEGVAGWSWVGLLHPEDGERTRAAWAEAVGSAAPGYQVEHRLRMADGSYRWFLARAASARDERGRVVRWFGSHTDIDVQKRAAEDRRFLDELNEILVRQPDAVAVLRRCAEAVTRHMGADRCGFTEIDEGAGLVRVTAEFVGGEGVRHADVVPLARVGPGVVAMLQAGRARVIHDTEREVPAEVRARLYEPFGIRAVVGVPVVRESGLVCTAFVQSGTPRRWRPEEVDLLRVVAERAWSAHERARLTEAERAARRAAERSAFEAERSARAAEEASRAKDQFLAVLSHELRTPLNPVLAAVSAMEKEAEVPEHIRAELAMVRRNVELEARLIDDLLDLTRIGRGKLDLRRSVVDVHALVRHVVQICAAEAGEKRIDLGVRLGAVRRHVNGDPARLQQVLWNLLKNAIKFTPAGGVVSVETRDGEGGRVVAAVADSGIGIPGEAMPKIFDAFEQASPEINRRYGGLGLGLAISKGLVDAHGGTLTAASAGAGKGSTFTLSMGTVEEPVNVAGAVEGAGRVASSGTVAAPRGLRVLLVEDHADTARVMGRLLRQLGHRVTAVGSVGEATAAVAGEEFDLLLSDLGLPDASGHELMKVVRETRPGMVGVAISGYGTDEDIQKSVEAGFADHITKPINVQVLEDVLRRHGG